MQFHRGVFTLALLFSAALAQAQVATGNYASGTFDTPGIDTINVGNLNVHLNLPVFNKAGRGAPFYYDLSYDSSVWMPVSVSGAQTWQPVSNWGWSGVTETSTGYVSMSDVVLQVCVEVITVNKHSVVIASGTVTEYSNYVYHDAWGVLHPFGGSVTQETGFCGNSTSGTIGPVAVDGSGYQYINGVVQDRFGHQINAPVNNTSGAATYTDPNGNEISANVSGQFIDTTGGVVLTVAGGAPPSTGTFTYRDTNGNPQTVSMAYATYTVQTAFGCSGIGEYGPTPQALVSSMTYPDGSTYNFSYESTPGAPGNVTGRLAGVQLPQGGWVYYTYGGGNNGIECADGSAAGLTRAQNSDSGSAASTRAYARTSPSGAGTSHTEAVDGLGNDMEYDFVEVPNVTVNGLSAAYYETNRSVYRGAANGSPIVSRQTCYNAASVPCTATAITLPFIQVDTYNTLNGVQMTGSTAHYNAYGAPTELLTYDFGGPSSRGAILRNEIWTYNGSFTNLPTQDEILDGNGNEAGNTIYAYDAAPPAVSSGVPQHVAVSGPRGNLATVTQYASPSIAYTASATYEDTGSVLTVTSPTGTGSLSYDPTFAYLTGAALPTPSSGVVLTAGASYEPSYTGLPLSVTDANGQVTTSSYDSMLRPTRQNSPDGGATIWSYTPTTVTTNSYQSSNVYGQATTQYDGYGRVSRTFTANGQSGNPWYQQDTCYDANGNASFVSYRYQGSGPASSKVCSGAGTTYTHDALGRLTSVVQSDGEARATTYFGRVKQTVDELGVTRIAQVDGLGRKVVVCEVSQSGGLPGFATPTNCGTDIAGTGFTTTYSYALATGTTTVNQGGQIRVFQSDWLGRPISVTEPESGTTNYSYAYNATGLQVTRTRPRANQTNPGVTTATTYQYDTLGRIVSTAYNDGTATKTYVYDQGAGWGGVYAQQSNMAGRLSEEYIGSAATIFGYDPMGRTTFMGECTPSTCGKSGFVLNYSYDWQGNLLTAAGGSGYVTYTYSPANEVQSITSSMSDSTHPSNLVSNVQNGPFGPLSWQLGNGLGAARQYDFKGRIASGWVCNGAAQPGCPGGMVNGFSDGWMGSYLTSACESVLGQCSNYGYDSFGRLASATSYAGNPGGFTYEYDRWGNRWQQTLTSGSGPQPQLSFNTSTNQIAVSGYVYDAAGNLTSDGFHTYSYDADGNLTQVDGGSTAQYVYNASNQRVETNTGGNISDFIFNASGQRALIWDGLHQSLVQGQNYWGKMPVEYYDTAANFQHQNWLGTERATTSYAGNMESTYASLPFGDGYAISGLDGDAYHFAMLDHDATSNTDHAQYRQYASLSGRWMRPDPYYGSYRLGNPQSFNRYAYTKNNPLSRTDPAGLDDCDCDGADDDSGGGVGGDAAGAGSAMGAAGASAGADPGGGGASDAGSAMGDAGGVAGGDGVGGNPIVPGTTVTVDGSDPNSCDPSQNPFCVAPSAAPATPLSPSMAGPGGDSAQVCTTGLTGITKCNTIPGTSPQATINDIADSISNVICVSQTMGRNIINTSAGENVHSLAVILISFLAGPEAGMTAVSAEGAYQAGIAYAQCKLGNQP